MCTKDVFGTLEVPEHLYGTTVSKLNEVGAKREKEAEGKEVKIVFKKKIMIE